MFYPVYYAFRSTARIIFKMASKIVSAFFWVVIAVLTTVTKSLSWICHFIAIPVAIAAAAYTLFLGYKNGFSTEHVYTLIGVALAAVAYFFLPVIAAFLEEARGNVKNYILTPIFVVSPVKYTI